MKTIRCAALVFTLTQICFVFCNCTYFTPTEITTSSPKGTYKVFMREKEENGLDYIVNFDVEKQERILIEDRRFNRDSGRFLASGVKTNWLQENILTFNYMDLASSVSPDRISVVNQTEKVIRYLKITAVDKYLLLELQPHSKTQLTAYPQDAKTANLSWINVVGMFDDGDEIPASGMNFEISGRKYNLSAQYCVTIKENEVLVQSRDFEGYRDTNIVSGAKNPSCQ